MSHRFSGKTCRMLTMFVLTFGFMVLEVVYGYMTHSMALIADSFHMLSDVLALVIAFICMKISKRTRTSRNTFGWVRAEVLGALVNTVFLIALSFSIILESIQRLFEYQYIKDPVKVLIVGSAGLAVNIIGLVLFHGHGSHGHGHSHSPVKSSTVHEMVVQETRSNSGVSNDSDTGNGNGKKKIMATTSSQQMNMHGIWLHVLGDAFGSIVVIVNAVINWQVNVEFLKRYLDPLLSLLLSAIIIGTSIPLLKESALILLQTVPSHIDVQEMERKLINQFGHRIVAVHDFHVWRLSGNKIVATLHVSTRGGLDSYMELGEKLKEFFHHEGIHSTTIQLELADAGNSIGQCRLKCPKSMDNGVRICASDLCCIPPPTPTIQIVTAKNLFFDNDKMYPFTNANLNSSFRRACGENTLMYI